jgi:hypothetical protein
MACCRCSVRMAFSVSTTRAVFCSFSILSFLLARHRAAALRFFARYLSRLASGDKGLTFRLDFFL